VDIVMPIGEAHLEDLHKNGISPSNTRMLYMGVSHDFVPKDNIAQKNPSQSIRLIYTGTVSKVRGRDVMLEAMALLAKENTVAHLTIIGCSEEQLKFCSQRIHELSIENMVTLLGRMSGKDIPAYLAQADVGICLWERTVWTEFNPPTKLFEYLVAGLPILASNISSHTRYVHHWRNGLIFDYDANSLAKTIVTLNNQKSKIGDLRKQAKDSGNQYLWERIEPIFLREVQKLVAI
jgi:glycosyltransferase involved in cell wall biosynthesis